METVRKLERLVGGCWHGISFLDDMEDIQQEVEVCQVPRFCEAIKFPVQHKMIIKTIQFTCPGACYSFGGMVDLKETMIDKMVETKGYSPDHALRLFEDIPHFQKMPEMIGFNCKNKPDVVISQLQPKQAMDLLQQYHIKLGKTFHTEISSVVSACGNTAVRALKKQDLAISFGCDESRTLGNLSRDRLYVGLPYALAEKLIQ